MTIRAKFRIPGRVLPRTAAQTPPAAVEHDIAAAPRPYRLRDRAPCCPAECTAPVWYQNPRCLLCTDREEDPPVPSPIAGPGTQDAGPGCRSNNPSIVRRVFAAMRHSTDDAPGRAGRAAGGWPARRGRIRRTAPAIPTGAGRDRRGPPHLRHRQGGGPQQFWVPAPVDDQGRGFRCNEDTAPNANSSLVRAN